MHGGTSPGAPKGEANGAFKHGGFTAEAIELRREASWLLKAVRDGPSDLAPLEPARAAELDVFELLEALGVKQTRADRSQRNKARWSAGDRRPWGGEFRKPYPPGRGSRWRRQSSEAVRIRWGE